MTMTITIESAGINNGNRNDNNNKNFYCGLCLSSGSNVANPCETKCGHIFCEKCITSVIEKERGGTRARFAPCPQCQHLCSLYSIISLENGTYLKYSNIESIWGQIYVQVKCI
eukprot:Pgem_evm1s851